MPMGLIVDDESDILELLKFIFENEGIEVLLAEDNISAMNTLKQNEGRVDFVLSDIRMPNGGGMKLLQDIKSKYAKPPMVFLMTGYSECDEADAMAKGAEAIFRKPIRLTELVKKISTTLQVG